MTDERQTQTAAPSPTDGETTDNPAPDAPATATATAAPPEPPKEETADEPATEATASTDASTEPADDAETADEPAEEPQAAAEETAEPPADAKASEEETADDSDEPQAAAESEGGSDEAATKAEDSEATEDAQAEAKSDDAEPAAEAEAKAEATAETEAKTEAKAETETKTEAGSDDAEPAADAAEEAAPAAEAKADAAGSDAADAADDDGDDASDDASGDEKAAKPELDDPALKELRKAKEEGTTVQGKVIGWNRGGFHVVIDEVTAFCPSSEMELGRPKSPNAYMDRELDFRVVKFQRRGRRVVLSRAELLKKKRDQVLEGLQKGAVAQGIVTSLPDFGAFVDLGGVEGLVHVSELSRQRIKKPTDMLELGQQVEVKVLKIEKGGDRISLSMKALEPNPWDDVAKKYPRGSEFEGKVLRKADFGLFVELEPDVEGLIHVSQFPPGKGIDDDDVQPGKTVQGWIREVEPKRERISLSLREVPEDDPWKTVTERFPEGEIVEGTVESIAPFGVFINLAPGLTGLLPNSETGLPRGTSAARVFHPGQTVEIQVLSIDTRRKRISLGQKGSRVEATKADLQAYRQQQKAQEEDAPSGAMAAAFARLKDDLDVPAEEAD